MPDPPPPEGRRYRFGPLERKGMVAGLTPGQVISVGVGLCGAVLVLRVSPSPAGTLGALLVLAAGVAASLVNVGGRSVEEWAPVVWRWLADGAGRRRRWVSPSPTAGSPSGPGGRCDPPAVLAGCRLGEATSPADRRVLGVVHDDRAATATAVISVSGGGFALLDGAEKDQRVGAWGALLAGLARDGSPLHRLQWVERSLPSDEEQALEIPPGDGEGVASYSELVSQVAPAAPVHEVLLAVSVRRARRGLSRQADRAATLGAALAREVATLESNLRGVGIDVHGALGPVALGAALAAGFCRPRHSHRSPWPMATDARWQWLRADGWWHVTYWVAEWPRADVGPDFLTPLLLLGPGVRAVAVTMEPVAPRRATREVESARTAGVADDELRRRGGFLATARRRRQQSGIAQRESELADGHADYRFSGYVTVSARSPEEIEAGCSEVEHAAGQARLELRRLYGQQGVAFTYTLPLCRGLA